MPQLCLCHWNHCLHRAKFENVLPNICSDSSSIYYSPERESSVNHDSILQSLSNISAWSNSVQRRRCWQHLVTTLWKAFKGTNIWNNFMNSLFFSSQQCIQGNISIDESWKTADLKSFSIQAETNSSYIFNFVSISFVPGQKISRSRRKREEGWSVQVLGRARADGTTPIKTCKQQANDYKSRRPKSARTDTLVESSSIQHPRHSYHVCCCCEGKDGEMVHASCPLVLTFGECWPNFSCYRCATAGYLWYFVCQASKHFKPDKLLQSSLAQGTFSTFCALFTARCQLITRPWVIPQLVTPINLLAAFSYCTQAVPHSQCVFLISPP